MDDATEESIRRLELVAQAEDASQTIDAASWLDARTVAALVAAHQAVLDYDMDMALEAVKHPETGQTLAAHERLRQVAALAFLLGAVASPTFVQEVSDLFLTGRVGRTTPYN